MVGDKRPKAAPCHAFIGCTLTVLARSTYRGFWGESEDNIKLSGRFVEFWFRLSIDKSAEIHILGVPLPCDFSSTSLGLNSTLCDRRQTLGYVTVREKGRSDGVSLCGPEQH